MNALQLGKRFELRHISIRVRNLVPIAVAERKLLPSSCCVELPTLYEAHSRFTQAGLLEFQSCLQPMAVGLKAGRLGRPRDIDLALRACVLQLDRSPALPRAKPAWWYARYAATLPVPAAPSTLAAASLPPAFGLSWPSCEATAALKSVAAPIPAAAAMPRAAPASTPLRPAQAPPRARAAENLSTNRERDEI